MEIRTRCLQSSLHIVQRALRLLADVHSLHLAGFRIQGHLPGDVEKAIRSNGLRIRSDGFRSPLGQNDVPHGVFSLFELAVAAEVVTRRARESPGAKRKDIAYDYSNCEKCSAGDLWRIGLRQVLGGRFVTIRTAKNARREVSDCGRAPP